MQDYIISVSSTADLTPEYAETHDYATLEYTYFLEGKELRDDYGKTTSYTDFYSMMRGGAVPTTSMKNSEEYREYFGRLLEQGRDIVHLEFSSGLTGSTAVAIAVAEELNAGADNKIYVIDTLCASRGQGLMLDYAIKKRAAGMSAEELVAWVEANKLKMQHWFTVGDLVYLKRSGRVSNIAAFVGTMMQLKPILNVNNAGKLVSCFKVRGRKKAILGMVEHMKADIEEPDGQTVFICHADCIDDAEYLKGLIQREFPTITDVQIGFIGPVIGAHSGPGTLAVFYIGRERYEAK